MRQCRNIAGAFRAAPMTRGAVHRVEFAAGLCRGRLTVVRVLEARGRAGGMVKIGRICPPFRSRQQAHESTGEHGKRWPPAWPSEEVPCGAQGSFAGSIPNKCFTIAAPNTMKDATAAHRRSRPL